MGSLRLARASNKLPVASSLVKTKYFIDHFCRYGYDCRITPYFNQKAILLQCVFGLFMRVAKLFVEEVSFPKVAST